MLMGNLLKVFRQEMGWRQEDLAAMTGYTRTTISQFENGARPVPTQILVMVLALRQLDVEEIDNIFEVVFRLDPDEVMAKFIRKQK